MIIIHLLITDVARVIILVAIISSVVIMVAVVVVSVKVVLLIYIKHDRTPETDGCHEWEICCTVFMRHDTLTRAVLVNENMIRCTVRCILE